MVNEQLHSFRPPFAMPLIRSLLPFLCVLISCTIVSASNGPSSDRLLRERQSASVSNGPLVNFQVYEPVLTPTGSRDQYGCVYTQVLMQHVFGNSYGMPFVGKWDGQEKCRERELS